MCKCRYFSGSFQSFLGFCSKKGTFFISFSLPLQKIFTSFKWFSTTMWLWWELATLDAKLPLRQLICEPRRVSSRWTCIRLHKCRAIPLLVALPKDRL